MRQTETNQAQEGYISPATCEYPVEYSGIVMTSGGGGTGETGEDDGDA